MMKKVDGFYDEIGLFESYTGDIVYSNRNIILPVFNAQLTNHPINREQNKFDVHIDYCYFLFSGVTNSTRKVYQGDSQYFGQINCLNEMSNSRDHKEAFLLEMLHYCDNYQYWDWRIEADGFSIITDQYTLKNHPFKKSEINPAFFREDFYHAAKKIAKIVS